MDFLNLRAWFDELGDAERRPIEELRRKAEQVHPRLLPQDHGDTIETQLEAAKQRFLACKEPFSLIRIGDCEIGFLSAGAIQIHHGLATQFRFAGLNRQSLYLRSDFIRAVKESELLGLQENWPAVAVRTSTALAMLGMPVPPENGVEVHLPYKLLVDGTLFKFLADRKVLLIGASAERLKDCLGLKGFLDAYGFLGPLEKMKVTGVIGTRTREGGGSALDYERVIEQAGKMDYEIALLACGAAAKPLAWKLRESGKTALDVGFVFDVLMGNDERRLRPVLKEVAWPKFP